jgi:hypothetical protein
MAAAAPGFVCFFWQVGSDTITDAVMNRRSTLTTSSATFDSSRCRIHASTNFVWRKYAIWVVIAGHVQALMNSGTLKLMRMDFAVARSAIGLITDPHDRRTKENSVP